MNPSILGYGEILFRYSIDEEFYQNEFQYKYIGGSELNVIISLASRGHYCEFLTSIPSGNQNIEILDLLDQHKVKRDKIDFAEGRIGKYYAKNLTSKKSLEITYDRKNTCFSKFYLSDELIELALRDKNFLIISGITPPLSDTCMNNTHRIVDAAKTKNIKIIYDINYRKQLWSKDQARKFNLQIIDKVDFLFTNYGAACEFLDIPLKETNSIDEVVNESKNLINRLKSFSDFELIAFNIRNRIDDNNNCFSSLICFKNNYYTGNIVRTKIVDCIGGGDSFMAAVMHGYFKKWNWNKVADYAAKTFAITHSLKGDQNTLSDNKIIGFK